MTSKAEPSGSEDAERRSWFKRLWTCCSGLAMGFAFLGGIGLFVVLPLVAHFSHWDKQDAPALASPSPSTSDTYIAVTWTFDGLSCSDGWPSGSIGRQGACSHHGGVVSTWIGSNGQELSCRGVPPIGRVVQEQQLALHGTLFC